MVAATVHGEYFFYLLPMKKTTFTTFACRNIFSVTWKIIHGSSAVPVNRGCTSAAFLSGLMLAINHLFVVSACNKKNSGLKNEL